VPGCTLVTACNYDASATIDDGTCFSPGDSCDDGNPATTGDVIQSDCGCAGVVGPTCNPGSGLESFFVEKYYVSDANDATDTDGGSLPAGSVTYRVFVDLADGWRLESVFGNIDHQMDFSTTTEFFNNEDRGENTGDAINDTRLDENTVALDSWLSVGGASDEHWAIPKYFDTDGSIVGGTNNDGGSAGIGGGLLTNADPSAGLALTSQDGLVAATPINTSIIGDISSLVNTYFGDANAAGSFVSTDGAYAALGGAVGPTSENMVCIGQFTTDGVFSFNVSFRIGNLSGGTVNIEQYTYGTPVVIPNTGGQMEIQCDALSFSSDNLTPAVPPAPVQPVGVDVLDIDLKSYPNPTNGDFVSLKFKDLPGEGELVKLTMSDLFGRSQQVDQFENYSTDEVHRKVNFEQTLEPGTYLMTAQYNGIIQTVKFIVIR
jgi:hypothetical protein